MVGEHDIQISAAISMLCKQWDLRLPGVGVSSPTERARTNEAKCVFYIRRLQYGGLLHSVKAKFEKEANTLYRGWVDKPKAERGYLPPVTRDRVRPVNESERTLLLQLAVKIFGEHCPPTPSRAGSSRRAEGLDDTPITSSLPKSTKKRVSGDHFEDVSSNGKKQKAPQLRDLSRERSIMPPPSQGRATPVHGRVLDPDISFTSTVSNISTFTLPSLQHFDNTQLTIPDDNSEVPTQPNTRPSSPTIHAPSSDYDCSGFDQHIRESFNAGLTVDVDEGIEECLSTVFRESA